MHFISSVAASLNAKPINVRLPSPDKVDTHPDETTVKLTSELPWIIMVLLDAICRRYALCALEPRDGAHELRLCVFGHAVRQAVRVDHVRGRVSKPHITAS